MRGGGRGGAMGWCAAAGLEQFRFYALDTMSCEGGGFGATELRPEERAGVKVG
jgi:hypothetical protein